VEDCPEPVCRLHPVSSTDLQPIAIHTKETRILGRQDYSSALRMTRLQAQRLQRVSRKQLEVRFDAEAATCTVRRIGRRKSMLLRAATGVNVVIGPEALEMSAGDTIWLHFRGMTRPDRRNPGLVVDLPPQIEAARVRAQVAAQQALGAAAAFSTTIEGLQQALERAAAAKVPESATEHAMARAKLASLRDAEEKRLQRLGLGSLSPPAEFLCPITKEPMRSPFVASDGHSYEREALEELLRVDARSPLTREPLLPHIFPNHNLKTRMREYAAEAEMFAQCGQEAMRQTRRRCA